MTSPVEKHFQEGTADTADLSTTLRSGRDDKGEGAASIECAEQDPFFITLGGPLAHDSSVEKHFQERTVEPQISPLRCAPVEMTKGRMVLPGTIVAE